MGEKALWPTVWIVGMVCGVVTALMLAGIDVVSIIAVFSIAGNLISLMLYGKMQKVESNTNGVLTTQQEMIKDLVETIKKSLPVDEPR